MDSSTIMAIQWRDIPRGCFAAIMKVGLHLSGVMLLGAELPVGGRSGWGEVLVKMELAGP